MSSISIFKKFYLNWNDTDLVFSLISLGKELITHLSKAGYFPPKSSFVPLTSQSVSLLPGPEKHHWPGFYCCRVDVAILGFHRCWSLHHYFSLSSYVWHVFEMHPCSVRFWCREFQCRVYSVYRPSVSMDIWTSSLDKQRCFECCPNLGRTVPFLLDKIWSGIDEVIGWIICV